MNWMTPLTALMSAGTALSKVLFGNTETRDAQDVDNRAGAQAQFAAEFQPRGDRGILDKIIDFANRLPRPVITGWLGYLVFMLPVTDIDQFVHIMRAYSVVPELFWYLSGTVFLFYFGGRMQSELLKVKDSEVQRATMVAAQFHAEAQVKLAETETDVEGLPWLEGDNPSIEAWKKVKKRG